MDIYDEEAHTQDNPYNHSQSVEELVRNITRRESVGRRIDYLEQTIGGNTYDTKTGIQFFPN